jgi:hypothetical protein
MSTTRMACSEPSTMPTSSDGGCGCAEAAGQLLRPLALAAEAAGTAAP